ncbi:MAG: DUF4249 domain-containing protein [Bacteroidota bacterium]|jgi:hypothetical protein
MFSEKTNKYFRPIFSMIFPLIFFSSCTKDIDVKIPDFEQKLVVEGSIEPGQKPTVILTWTAPYFGAQNFNNIQQYFVTDAIVTVNDGTTTDTLVAGFPGLFPLYTSQSMIGITGKTYNLKIELNGKIYTSTTTILPAVNLDSLSFSPEVGDTLGLIKSKFKEPDESGNNYRWFTQRVGKDANYVTQFGSISDDKFINGKEFEFFMSRGSAPGSQAPEDQNEERGLFKKGDSVLVKFCTIGQKEYRYFRSYYQNLSSNGNPFSAPATLESNIEGGAIGLWCGYGAFIKGVKLKSP